jgi:hypothetical protein
MRPEREADDSPPTSDVENKWIHSSEPPYAFMVRTETIILVFQWIRVNLGIFNDTVLIWIYLANFRKILQPTLFFSIFSNPTAKLISCNIGYVWRRINQVKGFYLIISQTSSGDIN